MVSRRYADDFTVLKQRIHVHPQESHKACRTFLGGKLKLTLNLAKTHTTHVIERALGIAHHYADCRWCSRDFI